MKRVFILFTVFFWLNWISAGYCLEWKLLHEEADEETLAEAIESLKDNPDSLNSMYVLGLVYLNLHKDKEAGTIFSKIIFRDENALEAKWGLAEVLRRSHTLKKSEELLNEVIKSNPEFSPAYLSLAYIKYTQMNFPEAVSLANKVLVQDENKVDLSNRVRAYLMLGGSKGMIAHYGGPLSKVINGTAVMPNLRKAQKLQPDSAGVLFGLGSFYLLAPNLAGGDLKKAEEYLKKAIRIDPLFVDVYVRLGQLYKIKGDNQKYQAYLDKALAIDPKNELALDIKSGKCQFICIGKKE